MDQKYGKPRLQVDVKSSLIDQSIGIRVIGLENKQKITVRFQRKSYWGKIIYYMESHGTFISDSDGIVDLQKVSPIEGTYKGVDGMGLFWSMTVQRTEENSVELFNKLQTQSLTIFLECNGNILDSQVISRKWLDDDVVRMPVNEQGVIGTFFHARNSAPRPTLIVVGGSEGGIYEFPASLLASHGFNVLALGYWGEAPLPEKLIEIPIECIEEAIQWLQNRQDVVKGWLGIHGTSKGGELALLAAANFRDIKAVVALSGSPVVFCGIVPWTDQKELAPSWTYKGKTVPYARQENSVEIANTCKSIREAGGNPLRIWYTYLSSDPQIVEQATIPVENINGPVLLISGTADACFDSVYLNEIAIERLKQRNFQHEYEHLIYEGAGHEVGIPFIPVTANQFTGGNQLDTVKASRVSWQRTIDFFWRSVSLREKKMKQESES